MQAFASVASAEAIVPVGIWNCVVFGHPRIGDERLLLRFEAGGRTGIARPREDGFRLWAPMSNWAVRRDRFSFVDSRSEREYEADLARASLGGTWKTESINGGWWCARLSDVLAADSAGLQVTQSSDYMPPLVVKTIATPSFPRQAIREAKEGHAVVCFLVNAEGAIVDPELVELSDEIFRDSVLLAISRSRYQPWARADLLRPGCRSFLFELDQVY